MSPWVWMAVTCLLLGAFGGFRLWREWRFYSLATRSAAPPFHLADLPRTIGTWQGSESPENQLDPEVARFAGASEHIMRGFIDEKSGERASALVLYGLATSVYMHTPDACYPAAGFQLSKGPEEYKVDVPWLKSPLRFRWAIYSKRIAGVTRYEETYFAFRHDGEWLPDTTGRWKTFRYQPGMFKLQISHPLSSLSESGETGPCVELLKEIARQIEARLQRPGASSPNAAADPEIAVTPTVAAPPAAR
ncbi:MAG: exosortase-associated EpsI family protein [Isosphaeraceae bacterium]